MKLLSYHKFIFILLGFFVLLFLNSCHSSYLRMNTDFSYKYAWKSDSSAFAFVITDRLYRMPKGIARFPDGGMSKTEYFDVALYYYDIDKKKLNRAVDFKDYFMLYPKKFKYQYIDLAYGDSLIFYKLSDASDLDIRMAKRYVHNENDSIKLMQLIKTVSEVKAYNVRTKQILRFDSLPSNVFWADYKSSEHLKDLRKSCLQKISCSDRNIILKDIYLQSEKEYFDYIVCKEGNELMRNAVLEQIIPEYSAEKTEKIIRKMTKYKNNLTEKASASVNYKDKMKKEAYDTYYSETVNKLKKMIDEKGEGY